MKTVAKFCKNKHIQFYKTSTVVEIHTVLKLLQKDKNRHHKKGIYYIYYT